MNQIKSFVKVALAAFLLTLTSCKSSKGMLSEAPRPVNQSQTLRLNIGAEPQKLDPRKARSLGDLNLLKMLMEGCTRIDSSGEPKLALAKSITSSDDGLTYTIELRKTNWSNGDALTANDFLYTWKKSLTPTFPSDNAHQLFVIKNAQKIKKGELPTSLLGVEVVNDYTLKVLLENPTPYFQKLLAMPIFFAVNSAVDRINPNWSHKAETYVSNGPFTMDSWYHNDKLITVKNPKYWDKNSVRLGRIEMVMVEDSTGLKMFENNELDWEGSPLSTIPIDSIDSLTTLEQLQHAPALGTSFIRANTNDPLLQNSKMRKALAFAIDRKEITEHISLFSKPAVGLVPQTMGVSNDGYFEDGNIEVAKNLFGSALEEMELNIEDLNRLTLTYVNSESMHRLAQVLQQQWFEAFGIMIQLQTLEKQVFFDALSKKNFQLSIADWWADFGDPVSFLEVFKSKDTGTNNTGWERHDFSAALAQSYTCANEQDRLEKLREAEQILMEDMPILPLTHISWKYVKHRNVQNVFVSADGYIELKNAYIGEE